MGKTNDTNCKPESRTLEKGSSAATSLCCEGNRRSNREENLSRSKTTKTAVGPTNEEEDGHEKWGGKIQKKNQSRLKKQVNFRGIRGLPAVVHALKLDND